MCFLLLSLLVRCLCRSRLCAFNRVTGARQCSLRSSSISKPKHQSIRPIFTIPYKPCTARPHIWSILRLASRYGPARGREDENGRSSEKGFHCKTRKMQQDAGIIMVMLTVCWIDCVILEYQFLGLFFWYSGQITRCRSI